jgi:F-box interacting protein
MSQSQPRKKTERIPYDVVYDIFTRLAVKSLMRFRCVSKSCNSIITNPIFIKTHLDRANNNGYLLYIDHARKNPPYRRELCTVVYNTLTEISRFQIPFSHLHIAGFCNGMFCFRNYRNNVLYLWNPTIRKFKKLANARKCFPYSRSFFTFGLAYHAQNNDFKILRIACYKKIGQVYMLQAKAEVYTLSTDSWREVVIELEPQTRFIDHIPQSYCLFHNGALHTILNSAVERGYILSFDVNDERFRKIMLPQSYFDVAFYSDIHIKSLAVIKGSLAFIVFCNNIDRLSGKCHIWVMREYGVVESWTRKSVRMDLVQDFYGGTDNGELLIKNATGLVSLDPESLNVNKLAIEDARWMAYTPNSMESLVLLDGLNVSSEYED